MVLFYKVFYLTVINYLLGPVNCSWLATSNVHYSVDFPTKSECHTHSAGDTLCGVILYTLHLAACAQPLCDCGLRSDATHLFTPS